MIMKKSILILFAVTIAIGSMAQRKPKINKAESAWRAGELIEAKQIVDLGIEHPKTKDDSKTWFMRGLVYATFDTTSNEKYSNIVNEPMKEAMSSFNKASELTDPDKEEFISGPNGLPILQSQIITGFWGYYINQGVAAFQEENTEIAYDYFKKATFIEPDSLDAYYYAGLAALNDKKYDLSLNEFTQYIDQGGDDIDAFLRSLFILADVKKEPEEAYKVVEKAKEMFPDSKNIAEWDFKLLYTMDKIDGAIQGLKKSIEKDPENAELRFTLGVMLERNEDWVAAESAYEKAIEINPEYYPPRFNLGVLYRNKIVELAKSKNALGISEEDQKKTKVINEEINELIEKSLPHWEKANELKPDEKNTLNTLQYLYMQMKDYDKAEAVADRMEELGFNDDEN